MSSPKDHAKELEQSVHKLRNNNMVSAKEEKALDRDIELIEGFYEMSQSYIETVEAMSANENTKKIAESIQTISGEFVKAIEAVEQIEGDANDSNNQNKAKLLHNVVGDLLGSYILPASQELIEEDKKTLNSVKTGVMGTVARRNSKDAKTFLRLLEEKGFNDAASAIRSDIEHSL